MSLDIGEIGVRVQVRDPQSRPGQAAQAQAADCCGSHGLTASAQAELVRQCVHEVLRALRMSGER